MMAVFYDSIFRNLLTGPRPCTLAGWAFQAPHRDWFLPVTRLTCHGDAPLPAAVIRTLSGHGRGQVVRATTLGPALDKKPAHHPGGALAGRQAVQ